MTVNLYVCSLAQAQAELARNDPSSRGWSSPTTPGSADLVLFEARWLSWQAQEQFEALPGVTPLGDSWEPIPAVAIPLLDAFRQAMAPTRAALIRDPKLGLIAGRDARVAIDSTHTVAQALRKAVPHLH